MRTTNLDIDDFTCRFLVVEPVFIGLGESALIRRYMPLWNRIVTGFGNHDPGGGRRDGELSRWDTLHPGRFASKKFNPRSETPSEIYYEALVYLQQRVPPATP